MDSEPRSLDALAATLHWGDVTPTVAVDDALARLDAEEERVRAFVADTVEADAVRAEAAELTETRPTPATRGPLHGVPVGVKDILHVGGLPTRAGSTLPPDALAGPEATAVSRLREAGAVVVGKTHTTEFAYFEPAPTRNPRDTDRTPGGSSSGSAAAVAAGEVPLALGTQTIGSVIRPAAFCGVVGFKPSNGRIPLDGVIPFSPSVDHVGTFTTTLDGAELAARVLVNDWTPVTGTPASVTVGVPDDAYLAQAETAGREVFDAQVAAFRDSERVDVVETDALAVVDGVNERHQRLIAAELAIAHAERGWYPEYEAEYAETTRDLLEDGRAYDAGDVADGRVSRGTLRRSLDATAREQGVDVWVSPAAPGPAPRTLDSTGDPVMNLPWTHAGVPVATFPAGESEGVPLGLQVAGGYGADEELLAYASVLRDVLE